MDTPQALPPVTAPNGPLAGYRVIELGSTVAGPFCGRLLADFGAEVIKVEPAEGDAVRTMGKRFHGKSLYAASIFRNKSLIAVDLRRPRDAVREVRRCVRELGFKAIRVLPWLWELPPTHARYYPVYSECCELGVPFCTQVGHTGPLMPSEFGRPIPYIDQVAIDFPELVIVGGHIGYPWTEEMVAVATKHRNVYIDTSAYTASRYPPALVTYLRGHGRTKVLFGSNWPMIPPAKALEGLDALGLDVATRAAFLAENAACVYAL